ncbi:unnamed protein product, partial [Amoebophrya sp. A120]
VPLDQDFIAASVDSYLRREPALHAIFDALASKEHIQCDPSGRDGNGNIQEPATITHLKEHSWNRFYQLELLLHPEQQKQKRPIRCASRRFRNVISSNPPPQMGFATQLLSYVEPDVVRRTTPDSTSMETNNVGRANNAGDAAAPPLLDDSFRHFLHLLEKALVRDELRDSSGVFPRDDGSNSFGTVVELQLLGERSVWCSTFRVQTGGVPLS